MLRRVLAMLPTGVLLTMGCSNSEPPSQTPQTKPAKTGQVTLLVAGMIERQGIT
jgi:hypothetical protein